jgi:hypothetical protein
MRSLSFAIIAAGPKPAKVPVSIPANDLPRFIDEVYNGRRLGRVKLGGRASFSPIRSSMRSAGAACPTVDEAIYCRYDNL